MRMQSLDPGILNTPPGLPPPPASSSRLTAGVEARVMHHGEEPRLAAVRQRVRDANR